jgi:hypothetical protein
LASFVLTAYQGDAVQQALGRFAPAGVAIVGASLIAITLVAAPLPDIGTFNTASDNATTLLNNNFYDAPVPFGEIPGYLPVDEGSTITPPLNFSGSPASGIIVGELGTYISPWGALANSITDGDGFNETLPNMGGAYFDGADFNLDGLLPAGGASSDGQPGR